MEKVKKADAFKALERIIDNAFANNEQRAEDILTITRFIEQQYEPVLLIDKSKEKAEGTI